MTEAICEALQKVRILQVGEVSHGCHQRRPQHLLWPRAGAMHAAEDYHHGDQCVLVIDRLQIARKRRVQGIVQNSGKWRGRQGEAWKMVFEVNDSAHLQQTLERVVGEVNKEAAKFGKACA